ncbi:Excalibur calcium-binding domain-containing protein [Micromonospora haikouensis]|uniref:Excalibur calcium-binding domain-containing protein n=1 Tax=Micromonospora haikouensis TaxID=686309 RepID=A0A1C4YME2_9ACTN|nr:excalibur calcium-binding domain-containing protein [Micromonospora haikouensis]SCF21933.1 Excalibur calcium-binding domain-containing protein [Micromonospora haikouensis]
MTRPKKNPSPILGAAIAIVAVLCCGGVIGAFSDDEPAPSTNAKRIADIAPTTASPTPTPDDRAEASDPPTSSPAPKKTTSKPKAAPYYKNCDAVRDADDAPLYEGEPGYRPELDRDGDGEACEPDGGNGDRGGYDDTNGDVYYANCTAVRAAGAAPIRRGDPGYSRKLDRDGDGVGCE